MKTLSNAPAQPIHPNSGDEEFWGLTKREYFAAMALQGFLASLAGFEGSLDHSHAAEQSVRLADALIEALNEEVK